MAEVEQKDSGGKKKGKQKKMNIRVDFTPMVDMNMLLLTFFMLCTSMSKPQTMEISMPSNDKTLTEQERDKVAASRAITLILGGNNRVYYYTGEPNYEDWTSLKEPSAPTCNGAKKMQRKRKCGRRLKLLRQKKLFLENRMDWIRLWSREGEISPADRNSV